MSDFVSERPGGSDEKEMNLSEVQEEVEQQQMCVHLQTSSSSNGLDAQPVKQSGKVAVDQGALSAHPAPRPKGNGHSINVRQGATATDTAPAATESPLLEGCASSKLIASTTVAEPSALSRPDTTTTRTDSVVRDQGHLPASSTDGLPTQPKQPVKLPRLDGQPRTPYQAQQLEELSQSLRGLGKEFMDTVAENTSDAAEQPEFVVDNSHPTRPLHSEALLASDNPENPDVEESSGVIDAVARGASEGVEHTNPHDSVVATAPEPAGQYACCNEA